MLTLDARRGARQRRARRHRGQGPPDVDAGDARRAARGHGEPRRGRRARRVHAGPRAERASRRSTLVGDDVYCVIDPAAPDPATLEAAVRLARLLALASLVEHEVEVDAAAIGAALDGDPRAARGRAVAQGAADLDLERHEGGLDVGWTRCARTILARVAEAEAEIRATRPDRATRPRTACLGRVGTKVP